MRFYNAMPDENIYVDKVFKWIVDLTLVVLLAVFFYTYMCQSVQVIGNSMSDKLENGDHVLVDKISYELSEPKRYDVIAFTKKEKNGEETEYIKRIIGLPGDKVQIIEGRIYVNGKKIDYNSKRDKIVNPGLASQEIELDYDEYFVIGDNWNNSEDSRAGTVSNVKRKEIEGKIWMISWPFVRIKTVKLCKYIFENKSEVNICDFNGILFILPRLEE